VIALWDDLEVTVLVGWNGELKKHLMVSVKTCYFGNQFIPWFKEKQEE